MKISSKFVMCTVLFFLLFVVLSLWQRPVWSWGFHPLIDLTLWKRSVSALTLSKPLCPFGRRLVNYFPLPYMWGLLVCMTPMGQLEESKKAKLIGHMWLEVVLWFWSFLVWKNESISYRNQETLQTPGCVWPLTLELQSLNPLNVLIDVFLLFTFYWSEILSILIIIFVLLELCGYVWKFNICHYRLNFNVFSLMLLEI